MEHAEKIKNKMLEEPRNDFQEVQSSARSLDIARNSSIDLASLNNKIVNMRSSVRQAKVRVIHKLTRNIDALKKKKGTEKQLEKLKAKQERLLEEIKVIKSVNLDKVSKYALWNTSTLDEICKQPAASIQSRALTRLAECCVIQDKVKEFRHCHSDWKSLAAYLVMKQSGRRYKKKKNQAVKGCDVESTNIKARHVMTDTYLQHKLVQGESDRTLRPDTEENENNQLFSDRVTRLPEIEGNGSPDDKQDEQSICQFIKCKDELQNKKKRASGCKKSPCLTQRLLKFFPDKTAESSSDFEGSDSENTAASKPKSVTEISRPMDLDTSSENEQQNMKTTKDKNVLTKMKPVTKRQHEPAVVSTGNSVSKMKSDSCILDAAQTSTDDSDDEIVNSMHHLAESKLLKAKSNSQSVNSTRKRQSKDAGSSSNEYSKVENQTKKLLHSQTKIGSKAKMGASVGELDDSSKGICVSKKSSVNDEKSSEDESGNDDSENGVSENDDSDNDDSDNDDSGSNSDDASDLSEEGEEEDNDMAALCVKKQQQKQMQLHQTFHTQSASKEMVIKKLNMETFSGDIDEEETSDKEDLPGFLIGEQEQERSQKKRKNDPFFISSDVEEGDSNKGDNLSDSEVEEQREASDEERAEYEHIQKARHAFKSDFVDRLGSKGYRRYDWTRQQEGGQTRGKPAGRGHMDRGVGHMARGRGHMDRGGGHMARGGGHTRDSRGEQMFEFGRHKTSSQNHWQRGKGSFDFKSGKPQSGQPFDRKMSQPDRRGPPEPAESSEVLHPSWEASKRRKEQATIHAFQGKKIKFDD